MSQGSTGCVVVVRCRTCGTAWWTWMHRSRIDMFKRQMEQLGYEVIVYCDNERGGTR